MSKSDDTINRQDAIDAISAVFPVDQNKSEYASGIACGAALALTYIKQLPSAQPEPHWTPCSYGMPKKSGPYFVTNYEYGERLTGINIYSVDCDGWLHDLDDPVAWMPMPDPYMGSVKDE